MVRQLLLAAAVVAVAAAVGEYKMILNQCGCGDIQSYNLTTAAYCPLAQYRSCNISHMMEQNCEITCPGDRRVIVFRNYSAAYYAANKITCKDGVLTTDAGKVVLNPAATAMRPTCAQKPPCNQCLYQYQQTCGTDKTCLESNIKFWQDENLCTHVKCNSGTLTLYNASNPTQSVPYVAQELFCTTASIWTNYSYDGNYGNAAAPLNHTVNCVLPTSCENCPAPNLATDLTQLPAPFRTGYYFQAPTLSKSVGSCSKVSCADGYKLYGFNSTSEAVTGLEYTSYGFMNCHEYSKWQNGVYGAFTPANMIAACLQVIPPPTTPSPCGTWDALPAVGGGEVRCEGTQPVVNCTGAKIQVLTADNTLEFEKMSFVSGKGWLSFDCDGTAKMWKTGTSDISGVVCKGFV